MEIRGLDKLVGGLKRRANMNDVRRTVLLNGSELQRRMMRNATFKGHYRGDKFIKPTGTTKRSIRFDREDGGFTARVGPHTHYAYYLELGTRYMSAQPFVRPSLNHQKQKFLKDMKRLMK